MPDLKEKEASAAPTTEATTTEAERNQEVIEQGFAVFADAVAGDAIVEEVKDTTRDELGKDESRGAYSFDSVFESEEDAKKRMEEINNS